MNRGLSRALALSGTLLLAGCARQAAGAVNHAAETPGFLLGLWHGFVFPWAWIGSLFDPRIAVYAVPNASHIRQDGGTGFRIYQDSLHLHGALAMILAPNGHLIVSNSDVVNGAVGQPSELVEFNVYGQFIAEYSVDPNQGGSFGLNAQVQPNGDTVFAAVDDNTSSLLVWTLQKGE